MFNKMLDTVLGTSRHRLIPRNRRMFVAEAILLVAVYAGVWAAFTAVTGSPVMVAAVLAVPAAVMAVSWRYNFRHVAFVLTRGVPERPVFIEEAARPKDLLSFVRGNEITHERSLGGVKITPLRGVIAAEQVRPASTVRVRGSVRWYRKLWCRVLRFLGRI